MQKSICIISGRYPTTVFQSPVNHRIYADSHKYSYIHCNWPTGLDNVYLNKIAYILQYIDHYDYIIWIDDDAFFMDFEKDIMDYAPKDDCFISFCKSPEHKALKTYLSSGQFIVKCNALAKQFFNDVLKTNLNEVKAWWTDDLGYFTNGDQDVMVYLLHQNEAYINRVKRYDYKCFNSRWENLIDEDVHQPLILHFTGRGATKKQNYILAQNTLNLHPSLVPNSLLKPYGIATQDSYLVAHKTQNKSFLNRLLRRVRG